MSKKENVAFKLKKKRQFISILLIACVAVYLIMSGLLYVLILLLALLYLVNELFFSDHNFYKANADYLYHFEHADKQQAEWSGRNNLTPTWQAGQYDTGLLAIKVKAQLSGKLMDPYVCISQAGVEHKQYLERSVNGSRYINISHFLETDEPITLQAKHCQLITENSEVLLFKNPSLQNKKSLIIAPHADDAELAAFSIYSSHDSSIVTITAGEIAAKEYQSKFTTAEQASLLKGRLRAWDSIAIPLWAGLKQARVIQLGYFCLQLKAMHDSPGEVIASKTAGISDSRIFREFNSQRLASDAHGKSTWHSLVSDLAELIEREKPDVIITPHQALDPHQDHFYSTEAVRQALELCEHKPADIYCYANHLVSSDTYPFGPVHTLASLPPNTESSQHISSLVSLPSSLDQQKNKAAALAMMHDLQTPLRWKKRLRFKLQSWFISRPLSPYGADEFFRKAIRSNELFYRQSLQEFINQAGVDNE